MGSPSPVPRVGPRDALLRATTTTICGTGGMRVATSRRRIGVALALPFVTVSVWLGIDDPLLARVVILGGAALILWLSEIVPPFVPTVLLVAAIPLWLGNRYRVVLAHALPEW